MAAILLENYYFIKKSFKGEVGEVIGNYDGIELIYGVNAFNSLLDMKQKASEMGTEISIGEKDQIVLLDAKNTLDFDPAVLNDVKCITGFFDSDINAAPVAKNALNIKGDYAVYTDLNYIKTLTLADGAMVHGSANVLQETSSDKNGVFSYSAKTVGKAVVKNAFIQSLKGYAAVEVQGADNGYTLINSIRGNHTETEKNTDKVVEKENSVSGTIKSTYKTAGAGTAKITDTHIGEVDDYKTVNVTNSVILDVGLYNDYNRTYDKKVTTSGNIVSVTEKITEKITANGAFTAAVEASIGSLSGYKTVKITNSSIGNCSIGDSFTDFSSFKKTITSKYLFEDYISDNGITFEDPIVSEEKTYAASGTFNVKFDKKAQDFSYSIGNITGYKSVTISGYSDSKNFVALNVSAGDIIGGKGKIENEERVDFVSDGTLKVSNAAVGSISGYKTVNLLNSSAGSIIGGNEENDNFIKAAGNLTLKIDKNYIGGEDLIIGSMSPEAVSGFLNVTISGFDSEYMDSRYVISGNIDSGSEKAVGSVKMTDDCILYGGIYGYSNVTLDEDIQVYGNIYGELSSNAKGTLKVTDSIVNGVISGFKTINMVEADMKSGYIDMLSVANGTVNLTDTYVRDVLNTNKLNIKKEMNSIGAYTGTSMNDTVTIGAKTMLSALSLDAVSGTNNKLVVNGTLLLWSDHLRNFQSITGKGEIATLSYNADSLKEFVASTKSTVKVLDLGIEAEGFRGSAAEKADDLVKKAYDVTDAIEDDLAFTGWLSGNSDCIDLVDYVKFDSEYGTSVQIQLGEGVKFEYRGNVYETSQDFFEISEGDNLFKFFCEEGNESVNYCIGQQII